MAVSNNNISNSDSGKQVQDRLLDAAEEFFSEKGFEGTSIREITSEAKCNVAAVNYHFGGKDKLYLEVFNRHFITLRDVRIAGINRVMSESGGNVTLEELLGAFATAFIEPLMDKSSGRRFMKLMAREMDSPHLPTGLLLEKMILPIRTVLQQALRQVCPGLDQEKAVLCINSVVAQLIHVIHVQKIFARDDGNIEPLVFDLAKSLEHIVAFSAAGIRAAAEGKVNAQNSTN
jgi:AcrR family transcriptional regulator